MRTELAGWLIWAIIVAVIAAAIEHKRANVYDGHVTPKHRPLQQIDIQGHMEYGPRRPCPAVYDAPDGNLRECL